MKLEIITTTPPPTLRERAYALRFDPAQLPPPEEICMTLGGIPIASRGNLTAIQGKSKVGKSAVISAVLGAALRGNFAARGDTLCLAWDGQATGAIIHLDTEQSRSDWHGLVQRGVTRSGVCHSQRLVSLPLVMFNRSERMQILRDALAHERDQQGGIDAVVIDGVADLCTSPNDEAEALELVSELMALSQQFHAPMVCVLHENPGSDAGKTRGHLGSELNRKAYANLRIDKDTETSVSTLYGTDMRKRDIPKPQGFCFAWNDEAGMHTFKGRAAGVKAAEAEAKKAVKEREYFEGIFTSSGTNGACPALTPDEAVQAHRDNIGTTQCPSREAMKKRMQRAESIGVLRKASLLAWTLKPAGQAGQQRDKP